MAQSKAAADVVFTPAPEKGIRFITQGEAVYLRFEDVMDFFLDFAATEATDVRNRMNEAFVNLGRVGR